MGVRSRVGAETLLLMVLRGEEVQRGDGRRETRGSERGVADR